MPRSANFGQHMCLGVKEAPEVAALRETPNIKIQRPGAVTGFAVSQLLPTADLER
jgi:hypothetical protein